MSRQFILDLSAELLVDNFAGGGGASEGIFRATGRHVDIAINHNREALGMHETNHPQTRHLPEDVFAVDPVKECGGRPVGLAWFSPDCKHFSKAKGGKPLEKRIRGLAWVALNWVNRLRRAQGRGPRVIVLENVEEFQTWGPLDRDQMPKKKWHGWFFKCFVGALQRRGYAVEWRELRACDYGAPTIRKRLFLVARCDGVPIVWPAPTHAKPEEAKKQKLKPWRTAAECIDWSLPCPSIFLTKEEAKAYRCRRPLKKNSLRRLATGVGRFVIHDADPFLINVANGQTTGRGPNAWPASEPVRTLTSAPGFAVAQPTFAPLFTEHANSSTPRCWRADEPQRTQCAQVKGGHLALAGATLVHTAHGEEDKSGKKRRGRGARDVREPHGTMTASNDLALAAVHLTKWNTGSVGRPMTEPVPTIPAGSHQAHTHGAAATSLGICAAHVVKFRGEAAGHKPDEPTHTISAGGKHLGLSCAYVAQHNTGMVGHDARTPLSTLSGKGAQQQVVSASLTAYFGTEKDGQAVTEPLRTVTSKPRFGVSECWAIDQVLTPEELAGARRVAAFLREHGVAFEGEFATVKGHVIVDLGMRMLTPRECFRAQGFGEEYVIDRAWVVGPDGVRREVKLSKEAQIRMCGNSVCPPLAAAIVAANVPDLSLERWAA